MPPKKKVVKKITEKEKLLKKKKKSGKMFIVVKKKSAKWGEDNQETFLGVYDDLNKAIKRTIKNIKNETQLKKEEVDEIVIKLKKSLSYSYVNNKFLEPFISYEIIQTRLNKDVNEYIF